MVGGDDIGRGGLEDLLGVIKRVGNLHVDRKRLQAPRKHAGDEIVVVDQQHRQAMLRSVARAKTCRAHRQCLDPRGTTDGGDLAQRPAHRGAEIKEVVSGIDVGEPEFVELLREKSGSVLAAKNPLELRPNTRELLLH